jgi:hypothetical protein
LNIDVILKIPDERATSLAYSSSFITASHEEIEENDEQDDVISIDDEVEPLDEIFSGEELPLRALSALTSIKNGSTALLSDQVDDDNRFSVSDVYAFETIGESAEHQI